MTTWAIIISIGLGTYALRVCMLFALAGRALPPRAASAIGLVAPAALSALVSTMLVETDTTGARADIVAVVAGFVAVRWSGKALHALVVGVPVYAAVTLAFS